MKSQTLKRTLALGALGASLWCSLLGNARAITVAGNSVGDFINPVGGVTSGVGTANFSWGTPVGGGPNTLSYASVAFSSTSETPFKIGTLTYFNGNVLVGTESTGVTLDVKVNFTAPAGVTQTFDYVMTLTNTPNTGTAIQNADYVTLGGFPSQTFTVSGVTYTMDLGFGNLTGGGFTQTGNQLHVLEGSTATADLMATVTTHTNGVPDGGFTISLLGGSLMILGAFRRKFIV